jgi:hypothetical protein
MTQDDFLGEMARRLAAAGIPYMVAGSYASSYHGQPRATQDVDFVIDPTPAQLDAFLGQLGDPYYVSPEAAHEAMRRRSLFNVIHFAEGWKADLIIRKDRPFSAEEFRRRQTAPLHGHTQPMASVEDVILTKLEWNRINASERQVRDARNVAVAQWPRLDQAYLRRWAADLGITEELEGLLREAEQLNRGTQG